MGSIPTCETFTLNFINFMNTKATRTSQSLDDYQEKLNKLKIKSVGSGAYATVYQHPTEKRLVVKVFDPSEDLAYTTYAKWCLKNQENKYVPKILHYEEFSHKNKKPHIGVVILEKLTVADCDDDFSEKINSFLRAKKIQNVNLYSLDYHSTWLKLARNPCNELKAFAKFMHKISRSNKGFSIDIHSGNILFRKKQIVFTDPLCGEW